MKLKGEPGGYARERMSYDALKENELPVEWLFDKTKATPGAHYIDRKDNKLTVYYFLKRNDNSEASRTVRHILLESEGEDDAVKVQAEAILAEWEAGDRTEASFAALAENTGRHRFRCERRAC